MIEKNKLKKTLQFFHNITLVESYGSSYVKPYLCKVYPVIT